MPSVAEKKKRREFSDTPVNCSPRLRSDSAYRVHTWSLGELDDLRELAFTCEHAVGRIVGEHASVVFHSFPAIHAPPFERQAELKQRALEKELAELKRELAAVKAPRVSPIKEVLRDVLDELRAEEPLSDADASWISTLDLDLA